MTGVLNVVADSSFVFALMDKNKIAEDVVVNSASRGATLLLSHIVIYELASNLDERKLDDTLADLAKAGFKQLDVCRESCKLAGKYKRENPQKELKSQSAADRLLVAKTALVNDSVLLFDHNTVKNDILRSLPRFARMAAVSP